MAKDPKQDVIGKSDVEDGALKVVYSPDLVFLLSTDSKNRDRAIRYNFTAIPPWLAGWIKEQVDSPNTPYKSFSDFVRDAIFHRAHHLHVQGIKTEGWSMLNDAEERRRIARQSFELNAELKEIANTCGELVSAQDYEVLREYLGKAKGHATDWPEPYRGKLLEMIQSYSNMVGFKRVRKIRA